MKEKIWIALLLLLFAILVNSLGQFAGININENTLSIAGVIWNSTLMVITILLFVGITKSLYRIASIEKFSIKQRWGFPIK